MAIVHLQPEAVLTNLQILVPAIQDFEAAMVADRIGALLNLPVAIVAGWLQNGITDVRAAEFVLRLASMARVDLLPDSYDALYEFLRGCSKHLRKICAPCPLGGEPVLTALRDQDKYLDLREMLMSKS